ncbi:hypothetical protein TNCV_45341 [Trichonephila clavipes]|nr:hypothetical protein TNCV_45341 [Trichonephila clavipes]
MIAPLRIKFKIQYALIATRRDTWQIGANVRNSPRENPEKVKRFEIVTPLLNRIKPQKRCRCPNSLEFAAALPSLSGKQKSTPGTPAATEETPSINENSNDKDFGFKDTIRELRRFFLDYPFLLEMGRQFSYAKDEERLDIFYQNLVKSRKA